MRVISGKYKGRQLKGPVGLETRPTGDRLRETLFNILGAKISGAVMLDVFGGTGAIGIEALSRGACEVVFIETAAAAQKLIQRNIKTCRIDGGYRILSQDAFAALRALARQRFAADVVFFDPPYDFKPYSDLLDIAFDRQLLAAGGLAIIEHFRKALLPEAGKTYRRYRVVRQGDHCLSFFEYRSQESE
jgi:16S rRNA (guanine(966)-N(2))-methyltransferase RsmD